MSIIPGAYTVVDLLYPLSCFPPRPEQLIKCGVYVGTIAIYSNSHLPRRRKN